MDLRARSIEIIKEHQHPGGSYVACPNYENYRYCWLRDGSFIAYAMDRSGEFDSARRFYQWVNGVITAREGRIRELLIKKENHQSISREEFLPTRYRLDGSETGDDWANFQLDGYGAWLWGLAEHIEATGEVDLVKNFQKGIDLTVAYLTAFWETPNFDCWEENGDFIHPATLACIAGGLAGINQYYQSPAITGTFNAIKKFIRNNAVYQGRLVKSIGLVEVDASLLWMAVPFEIFPGDDPLILQTVREIEDKLYKNKTGVHRYPTDSFYGGGAWILLTAWLGWYYARNSRLEEAREIKTWIESQASDQGELPEQVPIHLNRESYYSVWVARWGDIARPLLWSHAMYLILCRELGV